MKTIRRFKKLAGFLRLSLEAGNTDKFRFREMPFQPGADVFFRIMLDDFVFIFRIQVIQYAVKADTSFFDGFQAEQGVVDASQTSGGDEDQRIILLCYIVDRQQVAGQGTIRPPAPSSSTRS